MLLVMPLVVAVVALSRSTLGEPELELAVELGLAVEPVAELVLEPELDEHTKHASVQQEHNSQPHHKHPYSTTEYAFSVLIGVHKELL